MALTQEPLVSLNLHLDLNTDYGFTVHRIGDTYELPIWDRFRLERIREIFQTCQLIIDFGDSSRGLAKLLETELQDKT